MSVNEGEKIPRKPRDESGGRGSGQLNGEEGTFPGAAFDFEAAADSLEIASDDVESIAGAIDGVGVSAALEWAENIFLVVIGNADSLILNGDLEPFIIAPQAEGDRFSWRRVFQGVEEEVGDDLAEQQVVGLDNEGRVFGRNVDNVSGAVDCPDFPDDLAAKAGQFNVDAPQGRRQAFAFSEREEILEHAIHINDLQAHIGEEIGSLLRTGFATVVLEKLGGEQEDGEGRAEVVHDGGDEVGFLEQFLLRAGMERVLLVELGVNGVDQFRGGKRLDEVIVGAEGHALPDGAFFAFATEEDEGSKGGFAGRLDFLEEAKAVESGHGDIAEDEVRTDLLDEVESFETILSLPNMERFIFEGEGKVFAQERIILNDNDFFSRDGRLCAGGG
jgi:hypothetical protein